MDILEGGEDKPEKNYIGAPDGTCSDGDLGKKDEGTSSKT